jgi:hypothetical protein
MRLFGKVLVSAAALAFAGSFSMEAVQAAPVAGKVAVSSQLDLVAAKKPVAKKAVKKKAAKKPAAKAAKKKGGPGTCGVGNYWDKKTKACASAAAKKP